MQNQILSNHNLRLLQSAYQLNQNKCFLSSLQFVLQVPNVAEHKQKVLIYWLLADNYFQLKIYESAKTYIETGLKAIPTSKTEQDRYSQLYYKLMFMKVLMLIKEQKLQTAKETITALLDQIKQQTGIDAQQKNKFKDTFYAQKGEIDELINQEAENPSQNDVESLKQLLKEQHDTVMKQINQDMDSKYFTNVAFPCILIPMQWYKKWKTLCGGDLELQSSNELVDKKSQQMELEDPDMNSDAKPSKTQEEIIKQFSSSPIDISPIVEKMDNVLIDGDQLQIHTNVFLKQGLKEGQDFIIMSLDAAQQLYTYYGGMILHRFIIDNSSQPAANTMVEVHLQKMKIVFLPMIEKNQDSQKIEQIFNIQMSKKDTISNLENKIRRIAHMNFTLYENKNQKIYLSPDDPANQSTAGQPSLYPCKLWKLRSADYEEEAKLLFSNYQKRNSQEGIVIEADLLTPSKLLEELEVTENNIIVVEFKLFNNWIFRNTLHKQSDDLSQKSSNIRRCNQCGQEEENMQECICGKVYYCNKSCQRLDFTKHKSVCKRFTDDQDKIKSLLDYFGVNPQNDPKPRGRFGLVGLQNLGNTCFMNSSLQCLSNVPQLTQYLLSNQFIKDINMDNPIGLKGYLACAYGQLVRDMWQGTSHSIAPSMVKKVIGNFAPQFSGYSQQDSQEFLSYLLDGLHEDLNRVKNKPQVNPIESDGTEADDIVAQKTWDSYLKRNNSIITDLIAGQFKSTIVCPTCSKISVTFDPFMSVSVPIQQKKMIKLEFYLIRRRLNQLPVKVLAYSISTTEMSHIKSLLAEKMKTDKDKLVFCYMSNFRIISNVKDDDTVESVNNSKYNIYCFEMFNENFDYHSYANVDNFLVNLLTFDNQDQLVSYQKLFFAPSSTSMHDLYLLIYKVNRFGVFSFLKGNEKLLTSDKLRQMFSDAGTVGLQLSMEQLAAEFDALIEAGLLPFTLHVQNAAAQNSSESENKTEKFEYSSQAQIQSLPQDQRKISVAVKISSSYNIKQMKLLIADSQQMEISDKSQGSEYSIYDCLDNYIKKEFLQEGNEWFCSKCKEHKLASKKIDLYNLPNILIIHMKRFKTKQGNLMGKYFFQTNAQKIQTKVDYPLDNLDLTKYWINKKQGTSAKYELIGVSAHYGSISGGHYIAYAKNHLNSKWYEFNDSHVQEINSKEAITEDAYVLFFKKKEQ